MSKIKVLIADDHAVVRAGLRGLINVEPDMEIIDEAKNGLEAIQKATSLHPDVIILDITMPEMNGLKAIEQLTQLCPNSRILVLTMHEDPAYLHSVLAAGGMGYLVKSSADEELISAIQAVYKGRMFIDQSLGSNLIQDIFTKKSTRRDPETPRTLLSKREHEVLRLMAQGYTYQQIGDQLNLSVKTVETYRARFVEKLGLRSRADLVRYALELGLLPKT